MIKYNYSITTAYILGAGFSCNAGIPLQDKFLNLLTGKYHKKDAAESIDSFMVYAIDKYVKEVYGKNPDLEDIFTCLDLAANSGHHLGKYYPPAKLRSLRRVLISRIIKIINEKYKYTNTIRDFFKNINYYNSAFISLNWDTVIERSLFRNQIDEESFNYGCEESFYYPIKKHIAHNKLVKLCKVHGSTNWLYCDNCRKLYVIPLEEEKEVPLQILKQKDIKNLYTKTHIIKTIDEYKGIDKYKCNNCNIDLGTRMATFSYRKVLDAPLLAKSWFWAEKLLTEAEQWVFIGYSLPSADYEFKHLLKRVELSSKQKKQIVVVNIGDGCKPYYKFFNNISSKYVYDGGLQQYIS